MQHNFQKAMRMEGIRDSASDSVCNPCKLLYMLFMNLPSVVSRFLRFVHVRLQPLLSPAVRVVT